MSEIQVTISRPAKDLYVIRAVRNGRMVVYREANSAVEAKRIAKQLERKG